MQNKNIRHHGIDATRTPLPWGRNRLLVVGWIGLAMLLWGCASTPQQGSSTPMEVDAQTLLADDPANPTAMRLTELAGQLLMYRAMHQAWPESLESFAGETEIKSGQGFSMDPASGRPFVYTPGSSFNPRLPGRVVLHQPLSQGSRGRWALLINDLDPNASIVTYVERVPESLLPRVRVTR